MKLALVVSFLLSGCLHHASTPCLPLPVPPRAVVEPLPPEPRPCCERVTCLESQFCFSDDGCHSCDDPHLFIFHGTHP